MATVLAPSSKAVDDSNIPRTAMRDIMAAIESKNPSSPQVPQDPDGGPVMQPRSGRAAASPGGKCALAESDDGPRRGPVRGVAKGMRARKVDRLDGTPMGFMIERGSGVLGIPRRALAVARHSPGLHDASPMGLKARRLTPEGFSSSPPRLSPAAQKTFHTASSQSS
jgi:hypothetical protein